MMSMVFAFLIRIMLVIMVATLFFFAASTFRFLLVFLYSSSISFELLLYFQILLLHLVDLYLSLVVDRLIDWDQKVVIQLHLIDLHGHLEIELAQSIQGWRVQLDCQKFSFLHRERWTILEIQCVNLRYVLNELYTKSVVFDEEVFDQSCMGRIELPSFDEFGNALLDLNAFLNWQWFAILVISAAFLAILITNFIVEECHLVGGSQCHRARRE